MEDDELEPYLTSSHVECGCGFKAEGDHATTLRLFREHRCPLAPAQVPDPPEPWYSYVFSFSTAVIVIAVGIAVSWVLGFDPFKQ